MIVVLVGKTASGKTTVANELCKHHGYKRIVTYTTRPMRENEVQDVDYHFISDEQFDKMVEDGEFTEYKRYNTAHGVWSYGSVVTSEQEYSDDCYVIILTPQGLRDLSKKISRYIAFYLNVDFETQLERLKKRGDEEQQIIKRLKNDAKDFKNVLDIIDYSFCTSGKISPQGIVNMIINFMSDQRMFDVLMERHFNLLIARNRDNKAEQELTAYFNKKNKSKKGMVSMKIPKEYKNLNKYGLTPITIKNLIPNKDKIQEKPFWRNNAISAWCLSDNTIHSSDSIVYSTYDEYWLGVYDINGEVEFHLYSYGGWCKYHPSEFLKSDEIENKDDLEIQVKFLKCINQLIDNGTFSLPNDKKGEI